MQLRLHLRLVPLQQLTPWSWPLLLLPFLPLWSVLRRIPLACRKREWAQLASATTVLLLLLPLPLLSLLLLLLLLA